VIALTLLGVVLAADPKPAEAPSIFLATSVRVHLRASEELEPDHLRALARQNVTLWLSTRSNTLRASTLETINKFGEAWIALRAPVRESDARQLSKVPRAGLWIDAKDLDGARRVLGPRRLAINLHGPLDGALFEKLQKLVSKTDTVAVLVLTYKPDTYITEEAAGLYLAQQLKRNGYRVVVHDYGARPDIAPSVHEFDYLNDPAVLQDRPEVKLAVICCPWPQYRSVKFAPNTKVLSPWKL